MNREIFEGKWTELKGKVKEKWGKLTDDDITRINGKYDQLSGRLQQRYGYAKDQAEREINSWKYDGRTSVDRQDRTQFDRDSRERSDFSKDHHAKPQFNRDSDTREDDFKGRKRKAG